MAAANWRTLKKIDAHIHILPDTVHTANPDADDVWMYADLRQYVQIMRWTASSFTRTIPGWHSTPTIIVRSSHLRRSGTFPSPFIPIRMRRMICRRPEEIYASYCEILDQMDFTPEEAAEIAYENAVALLG